MKVLVIVDLLNDTIQGSVLVPPCFNVNERIAAVAVANDLGFAEMAVPAEGEAYPVADLAALVQLLQPEMLAYGKAILDALSRDADRLN